MKRLVALFSIMLVLASSLSAQGLPQGDPATLGFSPTKLARITPAMQRHTDTHWPPGMLMLVARKGQVAYLGQVGVMNLETQQSIPENALFRINSMTKPITAVAVMMLVEEGRVELDDPVAKYLPYFGKAKVYAGGEGQDMQLEAQKSPMTIRHLLTHTSGIGDPGMMRGPLGERYRAAQIHTSNSLDDLSRKIADLPLAYQPGTSWSYGYSTDILAAIVEKVTGRSFREVIQSRILQPLKMTDTDYMVPKDQRDRFVTKYRLNPDTQAWEVVVDAPRYVSSPQFFSGSTGLVSTAADYIRFGQMLLNQGELDGVRLLQPETVASMMQNHVAPEAMPVGIQIPSGRFPGPGFGHGLGASVMMHPEEAVFYKQWSPNTYWWIGASHTYFWVDPQQEIVGLMLAQISDMRLENWVSEYISLVYDALEPATLPTGSQ